MNSKTGNIAVRWTLLSLIALGVAFILTGLTYLWQNEDADLAAQGQTPWYVAEPASHAQSKAFRPIKVVKEFEPITEFPTVAVGDVGERLNPSELVLGVKVGKQSRAYPINMLTGPSREILNDTLDGHAIAATW